MGFLKAGDEIISDIIDYDNLSDSLDYTIRKIKSKGYRHRLIKNKVRCIRELQREIFNGTFKITKLEAKTVRDGPKIREVQAPVILERVGIHAIMKVFEDRIRETIIPNSASSIKGRGLHYLYHIIDNDIQADPQGTMYYYKCDIQHYYQSIDKEIMFECLKRYTTCEKLLKMFHNFVNVVPEGISIGLRSSQCFANLLLSDIDHYFTDTLRVKHYYRYCDDIVIMAGDKRTLWSYRDKLKEMLEELKLCIKSNEQVRPLTEGLDFLGFVHYGYKRRLRKRIKQNAARKLAKIKSRKRRQSVIGAFKGLAVHADCINLYRTLTHQDMRKFSELGVSYTSTDGKKRFPGKVVPLRAIVNKPIEVHDYEKDLKTSQGADRYLISFKDKSTNDFAKFFTASEEMKTILDKISEIEDGFPFETVIVSEVFDDNKVMYKFS